MTLELNGLIVECIIGDLPNERIVPQKLRADVSLEIGDEAARSDRLTDTVDYAKLAKLISDSLIREKCRMLEHAAKVVLDACLIEEKVRYAHVKVTKFGAIPHLESASVSYGGGRRDGGTQGIRGGGH